MQERANEEVLRLMENEVEIKEGAAGNSSTRCGFHVKGLASSCGPLTCNVDCSFIMLYLLGFILLPHCPFCFNGLLKLDGWQGS